MINDSFDTSKPLFSPKDSYDSVGIKPIEKLTDNCIFTFSIQVKEEVLKKLAYEKRRAAEERGHHKDHAPRRRGLL